jgi:hypothetical protein
MKFEDEKDGLAGEPARARRFLKLAGIFAALTVILWNITPWIWIRIIASMCLLLAVLTTARALFHLVTIGIVRLPQAFQPAAQIVVAGLVAIPPFFYFIGQEDIAPVSLNLTSWLWWATILITAYVSYSLATSVQPVPPVRGYMFAVAIITVLVFVVSYGGISGDGDGGNSSKVALPDPTSPEGKRAFAYGYLQILLASYLGMTGSLLFKGAAR